MAEISRGRHGLPSNARVLSGSVISRMSPFELETRRGQRGQSDYTVYWFVKVALSLAGVELDARCLSWHVATVIAYEINGGMVHVLLL